VPRALPDRAAARPLRPFLVPDSVRRAWPARLTPPVERARELPCSPGEPHQDDCPQPKHLSSPLRCSHVRMGLQREREALGFAWVRDGGSASTGQATAPLVPPLWVQRQCLVGEVGPASDPGRKPRTLADDQTRRSSTRPPRSPRPCALLGDRIEPFRRRRFRAPTTGYRSRMRRKTVVLLVLSAGLVGNAEPARASISIANNVVRPALRVDARGNAEVSWSSGGTRRTLLVPASGLYLPGGRITTKDVSRPVMVPGLPFAKVTRRGPDGRLYALQTWRVEPNGPVELHFSRWKGAPTTVALTAEPASGSERLVGRARFQGRPVAGYSRTNSGIRYRIFAFVDCVECPGPGWRRIAGVAPRADGTFRLLVKAKDIGMRYRVTIAGPNLGSTLAPDASSVAASSRT
jgi:hypothetical protein